MADWVSFGALAAALLVGARAVGDRLRGLGSRASRPITPAGGVNLDALYAFYGQRYQVDALLLKAIAQVESGEDPEAINPGDPSYGLGQVLCVTDDPNGRCRNELPAVSDFRDATPVKLLDPDFNCRIYSQILAWNIRHYHGDVSRAIVGYNNWAAAERGRGPDGRFYGTGDPEGYLERVRRAWDRLRGVSSA